MKHIFLFLICLTLVLAGCSFNPPQTDQNANPPIADDSNQEPAEVPDSTVSPNAATDTSELSPNLFNLKDVKVGDKIAGMTIKSIKKISDLITPPEDVPLSENNVSIVFSGQVTITGEYRYEKESEVGGIEILGFSLDETSSKLMPRLTYQKNDPVYISIANIDEAKEKLGITKDGEGMATIIIDDYSLNSYPSEVSNTGKLVSVVKK